MSDSSSMLAALEDFHRSGSAVDYVRMRDEIRNLVEQLEAAERRANAAVAERQRWADETRRIEEQLEVLRGALVEISLGTKPRWAADAAQKALDATSYPASEPDA